MISGISTRTRTVAQRTAEVDFSLENLADGPRRAQGRGVGVCVQDLMTPAAARRF
ncbi:MAG TPA: hypothetical protein VFN97_00825 [Actinospica sp.]|nr:hypothetical protein [Actinospica sp.]